MTEIDGLEWQNIADPFFSWSRLSTNFPNLYYQRPFDNSPCRLCCILPGFWIRFLICSLPVLLSWWYHPEPEMEIFAVFFPGARCWAQKAVEYLLLLVSLGSGVGEKWHGYRRGCEAWFRTAIQSMDIHWHQPNCAFIGIWHVIIHMDSISWLHSEADLEYLGSPCHGMVTFQLRGGDEVSGRCFISQKTNKHLIFLSLWYSPSWGEEDDCRKTVDSR